MPIDFEAIVSEFPSAIVSPDAVLVSAEELHSAVTELREARADAKRLRKTVSAYDVVVNRDMTGEERVKFGHKSIERHNGYRDLEAEVARLKRVEAAAQDLSEWLEDAARSPGTGATPLPIAKMRAVLNV